MHPEPDGAAFDIVLLLHVACVVVGLVTTLDRSAATASRLRRLVTAAAPLPEALRRYFRPGVNWAGRTIYGIPVFGFALLAMSQGAYALGEGWVLGGVALFAAVALVAEGMLWPAERRLQRAVSAAAVRPDPGRPDGSGGTPSPVDSGVAAMRETPVHTPTLLRPRPRSWPAPPGRAGPPDRWHRRDDRPALDHGQDGRQGGTRRPRPVGERHTGERPVASGAQQHPRAATNRRWLAVAAAAPAAAARDCRHRRCRQSRSWRP